MNGRQAKQLRKTAQLLWIKDVKPAGEKLVKEYQQALIDDPAADPTSPVLRNIREQLEQLPSPRRVYRRLKHLYTRRA